MAGEVVAVIVVSGGAIKIDQGSITCDKGKVEVKEKK